MGKVAVVLTAWVMLATVPVSADEVKAPIGAALMLELTAPRVDARADAFDEALRESGPAPRGMVAGELLDGRQSPAAMRVIGRLEDYDDILAFERSDAARKRLGIELGGRFQRVTGKASDTLGSDHRRSRVRVMPIFSPASEMASLMILTVTAWTRSS